MRLLLVVGGEDGRAGAAVVLEAYPDVISLDSLDNSSAIGKHQPSANN